MRTLWKALFPWVLAAMITGWVYLLLHMDDAAQQEAIHGNELLIQQNARHMDRIDRKLDIILKKLGN